jgi:hypothetical protein
LKQAAAALPTLTPTANPVLRDAPACIVTA